MIGGISMMQPSYSFMYNRLPLSGAEQAQSVVVAEHPGGDPAQPGKITDGQHDIPPEFIVGTGS